MKEKRKERQSETKEEILKVRENNRRRGREENKEREKMCVCV